MCKVLILPKIANETRVAALSFFETMKPLLSVGNKDGLGYAAIDSSGALFGERWHKNEDSFSSIKVVDNGKGDEFAEFAANTYSKQISGQYNSFGNVNLNDVTAMTIHTRFATSGKEFKNTHPFVYPEADTSLIHNGVINNVQDFKFKVSTCDSESILISYLDNKVASDTTAIQKVAQSLRGYYACGVFSRNESGARIMDVFKGPDASLYAAYIKELDTTVFCTSMSDIISACEKLDFSIGKIYSLKEGVMFRYINGELVNKSTFTPAPRWDYWSNNKTTETKAVVTTTTKTATKPVKLSKDMMNYLHTIPNIQQVLV